MGMPQMSDALDLDCSPLETMPAGNVQCVLLIDNDGDAMSLVQHALDEYGDSRYRLEWAEDLQSGVDQISKGGIDIVLLELGLPDGAGASSYAWVHQIAPEMPVLVLTGDIHEGTEFAVIANGASDFLVKDQVSGELIVQKIQAALNGRKDHPSNVTPAEFIQPAGKDEDLKIAGDGIQFLPDGF